MTLVHRTNLTDDPSLGPLAWRERPVEELEREIERLQLLLWQCHREASDGISVPFNRWLMDGGPDNMPQDVRELREAYDIACEKRS